MSKEKSIDRIKKKVFSLLKKTEENGATKSEALTALKMAQKLMIEYCISQKDLKGLEHEQKCVKHIIDKHKSGFKLTGFLERLSTLFNCEHYYTSKKVTFFGYEQDVLMCDYFYNLIIKSIFHELKIYQKSESYHLSLNLGYHKKTLTSSFIKGFISGVNYSISEMIQESKNEYLEHGLILASKKEKVLEEFNNLGLKLKGERSNNNCVVPSTFKHGLQEGKKIKLSKPIDLKPEKILSIEKK